MIYSHNYRHHARLQGTSGYPTPELATRGGTHAISSAELTAIAQDVISGDELISDSYDLETVDGVIYEANGAKITIGGESFDTGANASAEGGDEECGATGVGGGAWVTGASFGRTIVRVCWAWPLRQGVSRKVTRPEPSVQR